MNLVLYSSKSGNTKKLADVVFSAMHEPKEIMPIEKMPKALDAYNLIAVGFWFQAGQPDEASRNAVTSIKNRKLFLFATHGAAKNSAHAINGMNKAKELAAGNLIIGSFNCRGEVNPKVLEAAQNKSAPPAWLADAPGSVGHPDNGDMKELEKIVRELG